MCTLQQPPMAAHSAIYIEMTKLQSSGKAIGCYNLKLLLRLTTYKSPKGYSFQPTHSGHSESKWSSSSMCRFSKYYVIKYYTSPLPLCVLILSALQA